MLTPMYKLYTPGPTELSQKVKTRLSQYLPYYFGEEDFWELMKEKISPGLRYVFGTKEPVYCLASSGTGAMVIAAHSLVNVNDRVLVLEGGRYGKRWGEIVDSIKYGQKETFYFSNFDSLTLYLFKVKLQQTRQFDVVFLQLAETSTGMLLPVREIVKLCKWSNANMLVVVDVVSGLLADDYHQDQFNVDCTIGASQKCLQLPPGLSFISFSDCAYQKYMRNKGECKCYNFYFDLEKEKMKYYPLGQTRFTPASHLITGLEVVLKDLTDKRDGIVDIHRRRSCNLRQEFLNRDFDVLSGDISSNCLVVVYISDALNLQTFLKNRGYLVGGAPDHLFGEAIRIATMGWDLPDDHFRGLVGEIEMWRKNGK